MSRILFLVALIALVAVSNAFVGQFRFAVKSSSLKMAEDMTAIHTSPSGTKCQMKQVDKKGKCPGDAGYYPIAKDVPDDFAAYQAEMKAKKAAKAAAAKK